jgi:hypothetical protein
MSDRVARFPLQQIALVVFGVALLPLSDRAQYKGDHILGFLGLDAGTQAPPGLYVGNVVWIYPTSTVNDNAGHNINLLAPITTTATIPLVNVVTNYKICGSGRVRSIQDVGR